MNLPEDVETRLLEVVRKALTGELTRDDVSELPNDALAYVSIAMMLARWADFYGAPDSYLVQGVLSRIIKELVITGTSRERKWRLHQGTYSTSEDVRVKAMKLGLYAKGKAKGTLWLTLSPSPRLLELVDQYRDHPAVEEFFIAARKRPARMQESSEQHILDSEIDHFLTHLEEAHGAESLEALRVQLEARMER